MTSPVDQARAWMENDVDPGDREELARLVDRAEAGDEGAMLDLADRFSGPLQFGTAGLRGIVGAGESRMNRAVVIRATYGLVRYLIDTIEGARERGIVIGRDARRRSDVFQRDAAGVAAALGLRVHLVGRPAPTPVTAFAVPRLGAAAGVVVTASHNPPEYNGYKVYLDRGAQIIPPHDGGIAARIEAAPPARDVALVGAEHELIRDVSEIEEAYVSAVAALREPSVPQAAIQIAYTALHGVGERPARAAFTRAGFDRVSSVAEQAEPDGRFPTVRFPNPEEPAAMERLLALADEARADVAIANDPDADRLAAAVRDPAGGMQVLTGNEIGVLLAHHILSRDPDPSPDRLVITTIVSSAQLARIARDFGVRYAETLTGFKWIANRSMELERGGARFVFGYEEALGYTVGTLARDKDGIGAAVVFAELCAACRARGETVPEYLARIRDRHGFYVSRQKSLTLPGRDGAEKIHAAMRALRAVPPLDLGGLRVERFRDLAVPNDEMPAADVLMIDLEGGGRAAVRPSGTEPKIKLYLEVAESDPAKARRRLDVLERSLLAASRLA